MLVAADGLDEALEPRLKHLLEAGTASPAHLISHLGNAPATCPQNHAPSYHPTCQKVVIVWINVWIALALSPKMHGNQVRPEFGRSFVGQRNDKSTG